MDDRMIVPLRCEGCGAPLNDNLKCEYCNTRHERVKRYSGPSITELRQPEYYGVISYGTPTTRLNNYSTCTAVTYYGK